MMSAELDQVICSGPRRGKQFTYALLAERAPRARVLPRDEALGELTRRYFTSHGPATLRDYVWWSGLTMKEARRGVEIVGRALVQETFGDLTCWSAASAPTAARRGAHLLPIYDEYLIAYKDRKVAARREDRRIPPSRPWTVTPTGSSSTACSWGRGGARRRRPASRSASGAPPVADCRLRRRLCRSRRARYSTFLGRPCNLR